MIRVVLWDIDGTLLDFLQAERVSIRKCFEIFRLGNFSDAMLREYSDINTRYWQMLERNEMSKPEILVGRFREFFSNHGIDPSLAERFNAEYQVRLGDGACFYPGAEETVRALKGRVPQFAVTNGTKIAQDRKLASSGLDQLLDRVFISDVIGVEKPNAAFFDPVFAEIGDIPKNEIMIVGDSLTSDMRGGVNAGIVTCWFNREGKPRPENLRIDYEIDRIERVLDIVGVCE